MGDLFAALAEGLEASPTLALLAAFGWGLASVALSPCHLMGVPLAVGYLGAVEPPAPRRSTWSLSLVVALSGLIALAAIGAITIGAGRIAGDLWGIGPWIAAALLLFAGLSLLGAITIPSLSAAKLEGKVPRNLRGAAVLGTTLGVTLGPCTFAFMAPVLATALSATAAAATLVLVGFALGHVAAVAVAGLLGVRVAAVLAGTSRVAAATKVVVGALLIASAIYLIATAP